MPQVPLTSASEPSQGSQVSSSGSEPKLTPAQAQTLRDAEQEVHDLLKRKKQVDKNLSALEVSIYNYEGGYLEDTRMAGGNIVRGFDGFLQGSSGRASRSGLDSMSIMSPTGGRSGGSSRSSAVLHDRDRIFSHSSMTYAKAVGLEDPIPASGSILMDHVEDSQRRADQHQQDSHSPIISVPTTTTTNASSSPSSSSPSSSSRKGKRSGGREDGA